MYLDGCFMLSEKNQDYYHDKCINLVPQILKEYLLLVEGTLQLLECYVIEINVSVIYIVEIDEEVVNVSKNIFQIF